MDKIEVIDREIRKIEEKIKELEAKKTSPTKGTKIRRANVKKAVQIINEDKTIGMITLWDDGKTTICLSDKEGLNGGCYTATGEKMFYIMQAWATNLSDKIKIKPVEEKNE